jgi:hypothetical protein
MVLGAPRCGTSSVHFWLTANPAVFVPDAKETMFLDAYHERGLGWYADHFADAADSAVLGEVASTYLSDPSAPARALRWFPGLRTIALLRDPADRSWSHFWLRQSTVGVWGDPATILRRQLRNPRAGIPPHARYVEVSRYLPGLQRWADAMGRDNLLVLFTDELAADPHGSYRRICEHIGAPVDPVPSVVGKRFNSARPSRHPRLLRAMLRWHAWRRLPGGLAARIDAWNRTSGTPPLPAAVRADLVAAFAPELDALEAWLGREVPAAWRRPAPH